jgi:high-affinity iron transporter
MVANFLIGLREGLEAALIVGILAAYLVRSGRGALLPHVWAGVAVAASASLAVGATLTLRSRDLSPGTEDAIAGTLSIGAVALVTWMIFWMAKTSRLLRHHLESSLDRAVDLGGAAIFALALLSVGREGIETALFLWASVDSTGAGPAPLAGAVLGLSTAAGLGWALYRGAVRLNLRAFFQWTGAFLILVAAGVLAHGVHDLQEAGLLPGDDTLAFDLSRQIPPDSWYGVLLKGVFSFSPTSTVLEVLMWVLYVVPVLYLFVLVSRAGTFRTRRDIAAEETRDHGTPVSIPSSG